MLIESFEASRQVSLIALSAVFCNLLIRELQIGDCEKIVIDVNFDRAAEVGPMSTRLVVEGTRKHELLDGDAMMNGSWYTATRPSYEYS